MKNGRKAMQGKCTVFGTKLFRILGGKAATDLVGRVNPAKGEAVIAYGWAMAEQLADGLGCPKK